MDANRLIPNAFQKLIIGKPNKYGISQFQSHISGNASSKLITTTNTISQYIISKESFILHLIYMWNIIFTSISFNTTHPRRITK
jgi:hypothetical protein